MRYILAPSRVFDYAYFINNWGWFYGDTIYCNGNARSNGQFDVAGYKPTVTGQPIYDDVDWNGTAISAGIECLGGRGPARVGTADRKAAVAEGEAVRTRSDATRRSLRRILSRTAEA